MTPFIIYAVKTEDLFGYIPGIDAVKTEDLFGYILPQPWQQGMEWANVQDQRNLTRNEMLIYRFSNKKKLLKIQITSTFSNFTCHAPN